MADLKISGMGNALNAYNKAAGVENGGNNASFSNLVGDALGNAVSSIKQGEIVSTKALVDEVSLDELAVTIANAEMTLRTVVAVRDRIISAYQDIIKMPI